MPQNADGSAQNNGAQQRPGQQEEASPLRQLINFAQVRITQTHRFACSNNVCLFAEGPVDLDYNPVGYVRDYTPIAVPPFFNTFSSKHSNSSHQNHLPPLPHNRVKPFLHPRSKQPIIRSTTLQHPQIWHGRLGTTFRCTFIYQLLQPATCSPLLGLKIERPVIMVFYPHLSGKELPLVHGMIHERSSLMSLYPR